MGIIAIDSGLDLLLQVFENFHCGSCASAHLCESLLAYPKETFLVYRLLTGSKMNKIKYMRMNERCRWQYILGETKPPKVIQSDSGILGEAGITPK